MMNKKLRYDTWLVLKHIYHFKHIILMLYIKMMQIKTSSIVRWHSRRFKYSIHKANEQLSINLKKTKGCWNFNRESAQIHWIRKFVKFYSWNVYCKEIRVERIWSPIFDVQWKRKENEMRFWKMLEKIAVLLFYNYFIIYNDLYFA